MILVAAAAAILATPAWPQEFGNKPISSVAVGGLDTAAGAKILLIRAAGQGCSGSVLLPVNAAGGSWDEQYYTTGSGTGKQSAEPALYRTPIQVDSGCWCSDPNAGFAVMAPGKAVYYRVNRPSFRKPSMEEKKISAEERKVFDLCGRDDEIRVDLRPKREVPVVVWASDGAARAMAKDELANLDWVLDKDLAGITVRPSYRVLKAPHSLKEMLPPCYPKPESESACCAAVQGSRIFDPGALNVYYGAGSGNFTCPTVPASFVHDAPILGDAAHELSHALGLKGSDHEARYDGGHTTNTADFDWSNVMWEGTHFLKNSLSPGQVFWMTQSCSSWLGLNNSCLNCPEKDRPGGSACPPFSLGAVAPVPSGDKACTGSPACDVRPKPKSAVLYVPARQQKPRDNCETPLSIYKDGRTLENHLKDRYSALKRHVRGRGDLSLGSVNTWDFLRRWEPSFAYNIAPPDPLDRWFEGLKEADILPHALYIRSVGDVRKKPLPACGAGM